MQMKVHFDDDLHSYGMPLIHGRLELVLPHSLDCLLIQPHAERMNQLHVLRIPLRVDDQPDRDAPLKVSSSSILGELRLD